MVKVWRPHYQESKEVINMEKNTVNHSAHSTWRCQYHIVFAPKYRRKVIYGQLKADIGYILRKLCEEKKVEMRAMLEDWFRAYVNPEIDGAREPVCGRGQCLVLSASST